MLKIVTLTTALMASCAYPQSAPDMPNEPDDPAPFPVFLVGPPDGDNPNVGPLPTDQDEDADDSLVCGEDDCGRDGDDVVLDDGRE